MEYIKKDIISKKPVKIICIYEDTNMMKERREFITMDIKG